MLSVVLLSGLCLVMIGYFVKKRVRLLREAAKLPMLPGYLPVLGHAKKVMLIEPREMWHQIKEWSDQNNNVGGVSTLWLGPLLVYCLTDAEVALRVANECITKSYFYNFMKVFLGEGLVTADEHTWKRHRKIINPTFNQQVLDTFMHVFNNQAIKLNSALAVKAGKGQFDHWDMLASNALETICQTAVGVTIDGECELTNKTEYTRSISGSFHNITLRALSIWMHPDIVYNFTKTKTLQDEYSQVMQDVANQVLQQRKEEIKMDLDNRNEKKDKKFKPFLDLMLELGEQGLLTDKEIREELDTIIAAGHDTSSTVLLFLLIVVGSYPEVQDKMYKEVVKVISDSEHITKEHLSQLTYTEAVMKETLRLYPAAPVIFRHINRDVHFKNFTLVAGSEVAINVYGINTNKAYWGDDAHQFRPERWLDSSCATHAGAFASFSLGRRNCIGKQYSIMQIKINLAHIIRKFKIWGDKERLQLKYMVLLKPESGHHISLEYR